MIEQEMFYAVKCDNCKTQIEGEYGISYHDDARSAIEEAVDSADWVEDGDKIYCPDCYELENKDDDSDERVIIIDQSRFKP